MVLGLNNIMNSKVDCFRRNLLISLQRDSSSLRLHDIQQAHEYKAQSSFDSVVSSQTTIILYGRQVWNIEIVYCVNVLLTITRVLY